MRERSKMPILLTELTLMLLIFALCAGVCLSLFASARSTAAGSARLGSASLRAQSAAECYRAAAGDMEKTAELLGAESGDGKCVLYYDLHWHTCLAEGAAYILTVADLGGAARVSAAGEDGSEIFALTVKAVAYD